MKLSPTNVTGNYRYYKCANSGSETFTLVRAITVKDPNKLEFDSVELSDYELPASRLYDLIN